jgi:hypothetical protein
MAIKYHPDKNPGGDAEIFKALSGGNNQSLTIQLRTKLTKL